jgi:CarD family transcriptional regulator
MFSLNEKVVYPGHGVARINRIIKRKVGNDFTTFFALHFINQDMTILVPTENMEAIGIRRLSSPENIQEIFTLLGEPRKRPINDVVANWSKRNKVYLGKIRTGDMREIGQMYRDLKSIEQHKELSFGEKNLLTQIEGLLAEEVSLVEEVSKERAIEQLRAATSPLLLRKSVVLEKTF